MTGDDFEETRSGRLSTLDLVRRLEKLERGHAELLKSMTTVVSETREGKELLGRLNDQWFAARAFGWSKVAFLGLLTTYPQWSPFFFRIVQAVGHG